MILTRTCCVVWRPFLNCGSVVVEDKNGGDVGSVGSNHWLTDGTLNSLRTDDVGNRATGH